MPANTTEPLKILQNVTAQVTELIARNKELEQHAEELSDYIERLTTKLTAAQAATHTLNQEADAQKLTLKAEAERDTTERLERIRIELDSYLSEIDRRLESSPTHAKQSN